MKKIVFLLLIMVGSKLGFCCQPIYPEFAEISFVQDSINPLTFRFYCKIYADGFCGFGVDSCLIEWECPFSGYYGGLHLTDTIVINSAYPQAPILIYSGWHTFDSLPPDSLVYVTCDVPSRAFDPNHIQLAVQVVLNFAYLAHHTGVKSAYFNAPIFAYDSVGKVLYFDPQIQHDPQDSIWVKLVAPLANCTYNAGIQFPDQYLPGPHNVMTTYDPTGFLIWDSPPETGVYDIAYLVSAYRNGVFAYSMMRDMNIKVYDVPAGIDDLSTNGSKLHCYPSPTLGSFTIDMTGYNSGEKQISIYDQLGQVVYQTESTQDKIQINQNLSSGIYIVAVTQGTRQYTRVVIE